MQRTVVIELVDFQSIISTKRPPSQAFPRIARAESNRFSPLLARVIRGDRRKILSFCPPS